MGTTTSPPETTAEPSASDGTRVSAITSTGTSCAVIGFGVAAAITILFNTLLAWVMDVVAPLDTVMASFTRTSWITQGLLDVVVFLVLGVILSLRQIGRDGDGVRLAWRLVAATLLAGAGLTLWFLIF